MYNTTVPVGMSAFGEYVEELRKNKDVYRRELDRIPGVVLNLDRGGGRSHAVEYFTDCLLEANIRPFRSPIESLEYDPEGSAKSVREMFDDIARSAKLVNTYSGVVAVALDNVRSADARTAFLNGIRNGGDDITYIFFTPAEASENLMGFIDDEIMPITGNLKKIHLEPYTDADLAEIVMTQIEYLTGNCGKWKSSDILPMIRDRALLCPRDTLTLARELAVNKEESMSRKAGGK